MVASVHQDCPVLERARHAFDSLAVTRPDARRETQRRRVHPFQRIFVGVDASDGQNRPEVLALHDGARWAHVGEQGGSEESPAAVHGHGLSPDDDARAVSCRIGDHCYLSPGVVLSGDVAVEHGAFLGAGAVVVPGVRIGAGAVVAAGAVVIDDVPLGTTVIGVPAREAHR